jgi:uncharacterized protein YbjQ (UPF0145 family)
MPAPDLPDSALERLKRDDSTPPFSAHFNVNELLVLAQHGYEPLGQVLGASVFHAGTQWTSGAWRDSDRRKAAETGFSYEMYQLTEAFYQPRDWAWQRMTEEAGLLGATVVIGATIERRELEVESERIFEFYARGTALRKTGAPKTAPPVICTLSGIELCQLNDAGYEPVGLVAGNCVWAHIANLVSSQLLTGMARMGVLKNNQELTDVTDAIYEAREIAMTRLEKEARDLRADGILGIELETEFLSAGQSASGPSTVPSGTNAGFLYTTATHILALGNAVQRRGTPVHQPIQSTVSLRP